VFLGYGLCMGRGQNQNFLVAGVSRGEVGTVPSILEPKGQDDIKIIGKYENELKELIRLRQTLALFRLEMQHSYDSHADLYRWQLDGEMAQVKQEIERVSEILTGLKQAKERLLQIGA
jgi:hypothetical protein